MRWLLAVLWWFVLGVTPVVAHAQSMRADHSVPVVTAEAPPDLPAGYEHLHGPLVDVYGTSADLPVLIPLAERANRRVLELADALGVTVGGTVHVVVAPSQQAFYDLQPGRAPEWADGTAYPALGQIFLRRPRLRGNTDRPLEVVMDHELVHVLLGRAFAPAMAPYWLQEGVAQVLAGERQPETTIRLSQALASDQLMPLDELTQGFPRDPAKADVAYAQSAEFIGWFVQRYGEDALPELIAQMATGADVRAGLRFATGGALIEDIDRAWRTQLADQRLWLASFASLDLVWGVAALLSMVGLIQARRRTRQRMAAMAEEERLRDLVAASMWRAEDAVG